MEKEFKESCNDLRLQALTLANNVRALLRHSDVEQINLLPATHSEIRENIMLSYRHLEDARMRLGKAIQAFEGGPSCYDR